MKQDCTSLDPVVLLLAESDRLWPVETIETRAEGAAYLTLP